jgi:formylglycine-generating enzyme required for sulfatase activity
MKMNITLPLPFIAFSITSLLLFSTADGQRSGIKSVDAPGKSAASEQRGGTVIKNPMGMEFVYVPAGNFMMGSADAAVQTAYKQAQIDVGADHAKLEWFTREQPRHRVAIRKGFYMGRYEVTQAQWQAVTGNNPSNFKGCDQCPVEQVSWNDAQEFIRKLNAVNDDFTYSLPSEAQWEYACRAGTTTEFAFGNSLSSGPANFDGNYPYDGAAKGVNREKTTPVGSFRPNAWGLYDMHGNVWEWCEDVWHENYNGAPADGSAWLSGGDSNYRVDRGGSWDFHGDALRSAYRFKAKPDVRVSNSGLRVVAVSRSS